MATTQKPTIGRIVHYHMGDVDKIVPAIIVAVYVGDQVDLFVMSPHPTRGGSLPETGHFRMAVSRCGHPTQPGCWSWPPGLKNA